jgi:hypothetical protein
MSGIVPFEGFYLVSVIGRGRRWNQGAASSGWAASRKSKASPPKLAPCFPCRPRLDSRFTLTEASRDCERRRCRGNDAATLVRHGTRRGGASVSRRPPGSAGEASAPTRGTSCTASGTSPATHSILNGTTPSNHETRSTYCARSDSWPRDGEQVSGDLSVAARILTCNWASHFWITRARKAEG